MVDVYGEDMMNGGCSWRRCDELWMEMEDVDGEEMMSGGCGWRRDDEWWMWIEKRW